MKTSVIVLAIFVLLNFWESYTMARPDSNSGSQGHDEYPDYEFNEYNTHNKYNSEIVQGGKVLDPRPYRAELHSGLTIVDSSDEELYQPPRADVPDDGWYMYPEYGRKDRGDIPSEELP